MKSSQKKSKPTRKPVDKLDIKELSIVINDLQHLNDLHAGHLHIATNNGEREELELELETRRKIIMKLKRQYARSRS